MIYNFDAIEFLKQVPDEEIDCIVTDIAYESLEKHRATGTTTRLTKAWFKIFPNARVPELFVEMYRVLTENSHLYFFCDSDTMELAKPLARAAGFTFWNEIVWDKVKIGMGYHYRRRKEFILFFEKGKRRLNDLSVPDVLAFPRVDGGFPTEKPVELLKVLITQSTAEGDIVCDPFCGSGSALEAAARMKRGWVGNDIDMVAADRSSARLGQADWRDFSHAPPRRIMPAKQQVLF